MTKLSVIYTTFRAGSIDMLCDSLVHQHGIDYELIVVDDYSIDRLNRVSEYLVEHGIPVRYVGRSKAKCFPDTAHGLINAWNTGILQSTGEFLVFMQDYTWLPENSLAAWLKYIGDSKAVSGIAHYYKAEPSAAKDLQGDLSIWKQHWKGAVGLSGWMDCDRWIGNPFEMFYFGVSYEMLKNINGFPECYDYNAEQVMPFLELLKRHGYEYVVDTGIVCEMVNHRGWFSSMATKPSSKLVVRDNCFNLKHHRSWFSRPR